MTAENRIARQSAEELYLMGMEAVEAGDAGTALDCFKAAVTRERNPLYLSQLALCLAQYENEFYASIPLCQEALGKEPKNALHFLRMGKIQLYAGNKKEAIRFLRLGLRLGKNPAITALLQGLGLRQPPVLPFLARSNPINKYLGLLRARMGCK